MQEILQQTTWQEWLGVSFSIVQVLLARKNNSNNYLFGIAGILLSLYVMFFAKLYAEFTLNLYYLVMSIYGWLYWKFGKKQTETTITETSGSEKLITIGIVAGTFALFWYFLTHFTDSDVPIFDSLVSAFAWAGMWLMAKRKLENWVLWIIGDLVSIPLYFYRGYTFTSMQYAIFTIIAVYGYIEWKKNLNK